ncbi:sigma-70 family RNA polymerase sigma factor [Isosphaeraceae bacterium EP7]
MPTRMRRSEIEMTVDDRSKSPVVEELEWSAVEACRQYLTLIANRQISPSLRAKEGASDLVQETMMLAQRKLVAVRCESPAQLQAWLRRVLFNKLRNFRRSYYALQKQNLYREVRYEPGGAYDPVATSTTPQDVASRSELRRALLAAIDKLNPRDREVFSWRHEEGCSFEVIGRRLGIGADGGRKAWARAIAKLRGDLEPFFDEPT